MHDIPVVNSHVHICKYFCISHLHKYTTKFTTVYSFVKIIITICGMRPNFSQARNAPVTSFIHSPPQLLASPASRLRRANNGRQTGWLFAREDASAFSSPCPPLKKRIKIQNSESLHCIVACVLAGEGPVRAPILFEARIREDSRALGSSGDHKKTTRWSPTRFYFLPEIFERGWCSVRRARAFVCEFSSVFLWLNLGMFTFKFWCSFEVFGWCVSRRLFFEAHFLVRLVLAVGSYRVTYVCMYVYFLWCIIYFVYSFYLSFCLVLTFLEIDIPFILHRSLMIRIDNDENSAEIKKNLSFNFEEWGYVILVIVS